MKLVLENFRCYTAKIFEFPDSGITLLWGDSGKGKTTIFKAINFVLYGKEQRITTFGAKKSKVELYFQDITIVRTKTPNFLKVITPTFTGEDIVAQKWIDEFFGIHFLQTSYLSQKCLDNFFTQNRDTRAEILRALSIQTLDIEKMKALNKDHIKERKANLMTTTNELKWIKSELDTRGLNLSMIKPTFPLKITTTTDDAIHEEEKQRNNNQKKLRQLEDELHTANQDLQKQLEVNGNIIMYKSQLTELKFKQMELDRLVKERIDIDDSKVHSINQTIEQLTYLEQYKNLEEQLETIKKDQSQKNQKEYEEIDKAIEANEYDEEEYSAILSEIEYFQQTKKIFDQVQKIWKRLESVSSSKKDIFANLKNGCIVDFWCQNIDIDCSEPFHYKLEIEKKQMLFDNLSKQLGVKVQKCPKCSTDLSYINHCITTYDSNAIKMQVQALKQEISELQIKRKEAEEKFNFFNEVEKNVEQMNALLEEEMMDEDFSKLDENLSNALKDKNHQENMKKQLEQLENQRANVGKKDHETQKYVIKSMTECKKKITCSFDSDVSQIPALKKQLKAEQDRLAINKSRYEQQKIYKRQLEESKTKYAELEKLISSVDESKINTLREQVDTLQQNLKARREKAERFDKKKQQIERWQKEHDRFLEWERLHNKQKEIEHKVNIFERALRCALQMSKIITESESGALQSFLQQLNEECEQHMQIMFEGEMTLKIKYEGNEDTKKYFVDVLIFRNGEEIPYDSLSGGESDRCALVIFLAFNKLSNSKILLLDECLSSLHAESVEDIVDHIKTHFTDKMCIMTLHQTTKGIFDNIITL